MLVGWVCIWGKDGREWRRAVFIWCRGVLWGEEIGSGKSVEVLRCVSMGNVRWRDGIDGRE